MTFDAALVKEQGVTFAVVLVKSHMFNFITSKKDAISTYRPYFPGVRIILARQQPGGMEYYGDNKIVAFLSSIHHSQLPWKRYSRQG